MFFIQKKEINIGDRKKRKAIFHIPCSTLSSEDTCFQASYKNKVIVDELSKKDDIEEENKKSSKEDSDGEFSVQDF